MAWWETARRSVPEVAEALSLDGSMRRGFPCPVCGSASRGGGERRLPVTCPRGGGGWVCRASGCGAQGGWLDYLSWHLYGGAYKEISPDHARAVRGWCEERDWTARPASPAGAATAMAAVYPPDVEGFWNRCRGVLSGKSSAAWMRSRGFGSRLELVEAADLARLAPAREHDYPDWWPAGRRIHWRLIVRAWDVRGMLRSVHARAVGPAPQIDGRPAPKQVWPKHPDPDMRFDASGLFFADRRGLALLRGEPTDARVLLLIEGLTDTLTAAAWAEERAQAGGVPVATLGGVSGSWAALAELRERLPEGLLVVSALDRDGKGDGYHATAEQGLGRAIPRLHFGVGEDGKRLDVDDTVQRGGDLGLLINSALRGEPRPGVREELLAWWAEHPDASSEDVARVFDVAADTARQWRARAARRPGPVTGQGVTAPHPVTGQGVTAPHPVTGQGVTAPHPVTGQGVTAPGPVTGQGVTAPGPVAPQVLDELAGVITRLETVEISARSELLVKLLEDVSFAAILGESWRLSEARVVAGCERLRSAGYPSRQVSQLAAIAKSQAKRLEAAERWKHAEVISGGKGQERQEEAGDGDDSVSVHAALRPILEATTLPPGLVVPSGYLLRPDGLLEVRIDPETGRRLGRRIADAPMLVTGRLRDVRTGKAQLQVSWYHRDRAGGRWMSQIVGRAVVADRRGVVGLADDFAPVNSGNAADIVRYLAASEASNESVLPTAISTNVLGWQPDGSFLLGDRLFIKGGTEIKLNPTAPASDWGEGHVQLHRDELLTELAAGYRARGTLEGWREVIAGVADRPSVMLAIYAALIPPIMEIVEGLPNFSMDWSGDQGSGKTTATRTAGSVWGVPDEHGKHGTVLHTWDKTRVWIENASARRSGLPLILDDTKKAAHRADDIQRVLYDVEGGQGRGRGARDGGARPSVSYQTVLLSTGEYAITSIGGTSHGGAVARVIELHGSPLGGKTQANGRLSKALRLGLLRQHGTAGAALIQWLLTVDRSDVLRERYAAYLLHWEDRAGGNTTAGRAADYLAALTLGRDMAIDVLGLPECPGALAMAWESVLRNSGRADVAFVAMQTTLSWCVAQRHRFQGSSSASRAQVPAQGWLGAWEDRAGWGELGIASHELVRFLSEQGFEAPKALARAWAERGWLKRPDEEHMLAVMTVGGKRERAYYVINKAAWIEVMGDDRPADPAGDPEP